MMPGSFISNKMGRRKVTTLKGKLGMRFKRRHNEHRCLERPKKKKEKTKHQGNHMS